MSIQVQEIYFPALKLNSHSTVEKIGYKEYLLTMSNVPPMLSNAYNDGKETAGCEQVHIVTELFNMIVHDFDAKKICL